VVRKAAAKFGGSSIDVIAHTGSTMRVTSLNAKGSWTRTYDVDREVSQKNAEGTLCKTTSWWEGERGADGFAFATPACPLTMHSLSHAQSPTCCLAPLLYCCHLPRRPRFPQPAGGLCAGGA
jgi:hypothetical protein